MTGNKQSKQITYDEICKCIDDWNKNNRIEIYLPNGIDYIYPYGKMRI